VRVDGSGLGYVIWSFGARRGGAFAGFAAFFRQAGRAGSRVDGPLYLFYRGGGVTSPRYEGPVLR